MWPDPDNKLPSEGTLAKHSSQLVLTHDEVNRQRESQSTRISAMTSRATILVGFASLLSGVQVASTAPTIFSIGLLLAFLATIFGVVAIFPNAKKDINLIQGRKDWYRMGEHQVVLDMINMKIEFFRLNERALRWRSIVLRIGFSLLAAAALCSLVSALLPAPDAKPTSVIIVQP